MNKLGKREKRVAIAKDVIKQLRLGRYLAASTYFGTHIGGLVYHTHGNILSSKQVQNEVQKLESCCVCAIGAAFVSGVRLYDGISGADWDVHLGQGSKGAQNFFTSTELITMERWFELKDLGHNLYRKLYSMPRKRRMRIVFQSIIDNDGRVLSNDMRARFEKARMPRKTV